MLSSIPQNNRLIEGKDSRCNDSDVPCKPQVQLVQDSVSTSSSFDEKELFPSCLGNVVPFKEPLKFGLDDDSSFEEDEHFEEDFFFGTEHSIETMAFFEYTNMSSIPTTTTTSNSHSSNNKAEPLSPAVTTTKGPNNKRSNEAVSMVSDEGSNGSSESEGSSDTSDIATMFSSFRSTSSGTLTHQSQESLMTNSSRSQSSKRARSNNRRVSLAHDVSIVPIPMRSEYTSRVKERLWSTSSELHQNATRNSIEFAAEGWNWRTVTEDQDMLVSTASGELIHPIHLLNVIQMQEESNAADPL